MKQQLPRLGRPLGKPASLVFCALFATSIFLPAAIQLSGLATDTAFLENRLPAPLPKLPRSMPDVAVYRDALVKFVKDNFGLRVELVRANIYIHSWIGVSSVPGLIAGRKGWMFLSRDSAVEQFRGLSRFSEAELDDWIDGMERYQHWLRDRGIFFVTVIAPNKHTIYPELLPGYVNKVWPETRLDQLTRRLRERRSALDFVDVRQALWAARNQYSRLYFQYDDHWNAIGAFVAYSAVMQQVGKRFSSIHPLKFSDFYVQDVARRWNHPPFTEIVPVLIRRKPSGIIGSEMLGVGKKIEITRSAATYAPTILIYGDSYSTGWFFEYVAETFSATIGVPWGPGQFPEDIIKQQHPEIVVYELVERYLIYPSAVENRDLETDLLIGGAPPYDRLLRESQGANGGWVQAVQEDVGRLRFLGFAADFEAKVPLKVVFAYIGDHVVGAGAPMDIIADVLPDSADKRVGFRLAVPRNEMDLAAKEPLRFFGIGRDDSVHELNVAPEVASRIGQLVSSRSGP